jgi:hypothetical protein
MTEDTRTMPKKVKCPHCGTILVQGDNLCCQPLKDELNALANTHGQTINELSAAFAKWFEDHEVKNGET